MDHHDNIFEADWHYLTPAFTSSIALYFRRTKSDYETGPFYSSLETKYFSSHPPFYENDTKIFVWNCALHSASDVVFHCCAYAHIGDVCRERRACQVERALLLSQCQLWRDVCMHLNTCIIINNCFQSVAKTPYLVTSCLVALAMSYAQDRTCWRKKVLSEECKVSLVLYCRPAHSVCSRAVLPCYLRENSCELCNSFFDLLGTGYKSISPVGLLHGCPQLLDPFCDLICPTNHLLRNRAGAVEVAMHIPHTLVMSSDNMKPRLEEWAVTINFPQEATIISLFIGSNGLAQVQTLFHGHWGEVREKMTGWKEGEEPDLHAVYSLAILCFLEPSSQPETDQLVTNMTHNTVGIMKLNTLNTLIHWLNGHSETSSCRHCSTSCGTWASTVLFNNSYITDLSFYTPL
uniref:Uncharacterized protein n=1 Tax=Timema monikensis TaxID=170555 RepID=A0A7R9E389_9NEOP|nr:unnamed protein product [Timema monikensis]